MNEEYEYSDNSYRLCFNSITVEKNCYSVSFITR